LSGRLLSLKKSILGLVDFSSVEKRYAEIDANLKDPANQLEKLKLSKYYRLRKLVELGEVIEQEGELFEETNKPLNRAISQLESWRAEWLTEKKKWNRLQSSLLKEHGELDQLKPTVEKANNTINMALNLVRKQMAVMLRLQEKTSNIYAKINAISTELDYLITDKQRTALLDQFPPMFSSRYLSQFKSSLWYEMQIGILDISQADKRYFAKHGWILALVGLLSFFLIFLIYRNQLLMKESVRWQFIAMRPFSAGFFWGYLALGFIHAYEGAPAILKLVDNIVLGISFTRLSGGLIEVSWKKRIVYGVVIILIVTKLLDLLSFPRPLFRLYIILAALACFFFSLQWARESERHNDSGLYSWSLRLGSLVFAFIIIAEFLGKDTLAFYLFVSLINSLAITFIFMLLLYMIHGGLEWLFRSSPLRQALSLKRDDTDAIIRRVKHFIDFAILGLVLLPLYLTLWGVSDSLGEVTTGIMAFKFNIGSKQIGVGLLILSVAIIYGSFFVPWIINRLIIDKVLLRRQVEKGVRLSTARLVRYLFIVVGFLLAISVLGFKITELTIMLSALGVGIGFGLQGIVNNLVSGLILLFERPVRVGDIIETGGKWAEIKRIGLRATTVQTLDASDVIIPNADLVSNQVINWTLSNRQVRLTIPVGVAYGSDVPEVIEALMATANANSKVVKVPAPQVLFLSFGESSLDFELRVWVSDADYSLTVKSELHQEIERNFRKAKIEIAFPQMDLHLRSADDSVNLHTGN
jgi:small-conductance mechanosensitive channel